MNKNLISLICAISCSFLWGSAFIAQDMGMDYIGPFSFSAGRMFLGFIALIPFFFIFEYKKIQQNKFPHSVVLIYLILLGFFFVGDLHYSSTLCFILMLQIQQYLQYFMS